MSAIGDISGLIGTLFNVGSGVLQFAQGKERADNPPTQQRGGVGTIGGSGIPEGGFSVSDSPTLLNIVRDDPDFDINQKFTQLKDIQKLINQMNKAGKFAEAQLVQSEFNEKMGGTPLAPGAADIIRQTTKDADKLQGVEDQKFQRRQQQLDFTRQLNDAFFPAARDRVQGLANQALAGEVGSEAAATGALNSGRLAALQQLGEARSLRSQMLGAFENRSAQEFEAMRGGLDFRHENDEENLRNRLANDPSFAGRPDLIEEQVRQLKFGQRRELGQIAADISVKHEQLRQNMDINSANIVASAGSESTRAFSSLAQTEANIRNLFSGRRTTVRMNRASNDFTLSMLEREGRTDEANMIKNLVKGYIPRADILREAMGINIAAEDKERANKFGGQQQQVQGFQTVGTAFNDFAAQQIQKDQIEAQEKAASDANRSSLISSGIGAGASIISGGLAGR